MHYLGVDIGTSAIKVSVIDDNKKIVYSVGKDHTFSQPKEGYKEIDPEIWVKNAFECMNKALKRYTDIAVIGCTGQMHSTVFLDEEDRSIRPAILWNDLRASSYLKDLKEECAKQEETKYISRLISTGSPFISALWVRENEPDNFKRIKKMMTPNAYLVYCLTGVHCIDYCAASTTSFYDIKSKTWSDYMLNKLGFHKEMFGKLYASSEIVGRYKGMDVIAGTGDNPSSAYSMGILEQKNPVISLGTSGVIIFPKSGDDIDGKGKNVLFKPSIQSPIYNVVQGTVQSAGGSLKWWVENILKSRNMSIDQDVILKENLGKNHVLFFPHITGEKILHQDVSIRGSFIGLGASTQRQDMTQAVFEGVGYAFREILENMNLDNWPSKIQMNGGGTKSEIWMQILANILHTEIEVVTMSATPGYGICLLAYLAKHPDMKVDPIKKGIIYKPQIETVDLYTKHYIRYTHIYDALKQI